MHLVNGDQPVGGEAEPAADPGPVLDDIGALVARSQPDIQAAVKSPGDAAGPVEETVGDLLL